ncbi:MAG: hypothetical protein NVS3B3_17660 [Aquirhabdus sp.]
MPLPLNNLSHHLRRARPLLGTRVEVYVEGDSERLQPAIDAAFSAIEYVQTLMSFHDPLSDVTKINAAPSGAKIPIAAATYEVIQFAHQLSEQSQGAFDITVADVLVRSGFLPELAQIKSHGCDIDTVTYRDLELLDNNTVRWRAKGWIDLGGIAKGNAVDCAIAALQKWGIRNAIVNAGGDLRCFGDTQQIHVCHPDEYTSLIALGGLTDAAVATSAGYFSSRMSDDQEIHPIVDPKQRQCLAWGQSISVMASSCMIADALTKVVRLNPDDSFDILNYFDAQAIVIDYRGMMTCGAARLTEIVMNTDNEPML